MKKFLSVFFLCLWIVPLRGQVDVWPPNAQNKLWMPPGDSALLPFFRAVDSMVFSGQNPVQVVHIGGSHVQAGVLSDALRTNMQRWAPGIVGERGFFFPYTLAGSNNPSSYAVRYTGVWKGQRCSVPQHTGPWGLSGIRAITTTENARVKIYGTQEKYTYQVARVFYRMSDTSYTVRFIPEPQKVVLRPEWGVMEAQYATKQDTLRFELVKTNSQQRSFSLEGLQLLQDTLGLQYHAIGINGAATHSYLKADMFQAQLQALTPDLVIFGIGINDAHVVQGSFDAAAFESRYNTLIQYFKQVNPKCSVLFLTNNDCLYHGHLNRHTPIVNASMYALAQKHGAAVWDFHALMGGQGSIYQWINKGWASKDGVHLTKVGYVMQAEALSKALESTYLEHLRTP